MAHSNESKILWVLRLAEVAVFAGGLVATYFSENSEWREFLVISLLALFAFLVIKVFEAWPEARKLLIVEDRAAEIAKAALPYGLENYFNMQGANGQNARNEVTRKDIEAANNMWLCANSGASYLDPSLYRHWPAVEKKLNDSVAFRVVLLDPFSAEKGFRNQLNVDGESFDSKVNIANLIKLQNSFPSLEIRFVRYGMHATVFATDSALTFDPYHVGLVSDRIENRTFCMRFQPAQPNDGVGLYKLFKSHFDTLWRAGVTFEQWLADSADKLPERLPALKSRQYLA